MKKKTTIRSRETQEEDTAQRSRDQEKRPVFDRQSTIDPARRDQLEGLSRLAVTAQSAQAAFAKTFGQGFSTQLKASTQDLNEWSCGFSTQMSTAAVAMTAFGNAAQSGFETFAAGMAKGIANSVVYSASIGEAMDKALKATLASITAESLVRAIFNTGLGFYYLAIQAYDQAAQAFEAAAVFTSVAGAAGALGRAIPGGATIGARVADRGSGFGIGGSQSGGAGAGLVGVTAGAMAPGAVGAGPSGNGVILINGEADFQEWAIGQLNQGTSRGLTLNATTAQRVPPSGG
jgi:hypothetical protein